MRQVKEFLTTLGMWFLPRRVLQRHMGDIDFAFIIHPRDVRDIARKFPWVTFLPDPLVSWFFDKLGPVPVSQITGLVSKNGRPLKGWQIAVPSTAARLLCNRHRARKRILRAVRLAEKTGARVVGLGALTASLTDGGKYITSISRADIVLVATNNPRQIIQAHHLKPGCAVIDDAQPPNVSPAVASGDGTLLAWGGLVEVPGINLNFDMGVLERRTFFSCLAEGLIPSAYGIDENYSLEPVDTVKAKQLLTPGCEFKDFPATFTGVREKGGDKEGMVILGKATCCCSTY